MEINTDLDIGGSGENSNEMFSYCEETMRQSPRFIQLVL
jgi:hypothetical protein